MTVSGLSLQTLAILVGSVGALRALQLFLDFRRLLASIHHLPGYRTILAPSTVLGQMFPPTRGLTLGHDHAWISKHTPFAKWGLDIFSSAAFWPKAKGAMFIADANIIKDIAWSRGGRFPKPLGQYKIITFFGENIVASEGDQWKRYRKIVAPAFSERNNRLVWDATIQIMLDLFDTMWAGQDEVVVDHGVDLTLPIALFVIGAAGFGRPISWKDDTVVPPGHQLTFKDALHTVTQDLTIKLLVPKWAMGLTKRFRRTRVAFDELHKYLTEMIHERQGSQHKEENNDLLSSLLSANDDEKLSEGEIKLTDSEVIGNIFIFLVAGHETTAHTFAFAFALLALYPDKQEELYQHIKRVLPDGRIPTYDDMPSLAYSSAVFSETLRMFPPVGIVPKTSAEDTTLTLTDVNGTMKTVVVPQGTGLTFSVPGLHYNPKYWEDPYTFKPERFLGDWNRDAFLPFSSGYRGCVGRKFSETEGAAVLTILMSQYTVSIKDEPQFASETFEKRRARVLDAQSVLTLAPARLPLVFKRRT
ncbi:cytochrome P450 [Suillus clintonianus]|uniref:cytochrome P450 n=1 Tax=Suillus clintonianus TaxID=1904413 RepID=UPI001B85E2C8|nr:cytochrome P450 [Suillus clintonianus]KAG2128701.1 cytochrome P450 [Suillus clintonianus]